MGLQIMFQTGSIGLFKKLFNKRGIEKKLSKTLILFKINWSSHLKTHFSLQSLYQLTINPLEGQWYL